MIILQFDAGYLRWGALLLRSLALHEPRKRVLADTVGLSPAQAAEVRAAHPKVIVVDSPPPEGGAGRTSMANRKCLVLERVMDEYPREPWYCLMDADLLLRCPVPFLWASLRGLDAALALNPSLRRRPPGLSNGALTGLVLVRPGARPLVDSWVRWHWRRRIGEFAHNCWWWDCVTLSRAVLETRVRYAVIPPAEFLDYRRRPGSPIWSGECDPEAKDAVFDLLAAEHKRQRARA
ncbi:MAG: hypothetical protein ACJ75H_02325 [Thermoanaerobaculia bacterium]